ncbi:MAG: FAD-binding oxidoreductase [Myxococcota bacterium]|nr:FAD-binding oxidoreductase [Myxococcota bacterium]
MSVQPALERPLNQLPRRVFDGFGMAHRALSPFLTPTSADELAAIFQRAAELETTVAFRGSGRSYGDAAINGQGMVLDMRSMNRVLSWDRETGVIEAEPGLSIQQLWQRTLPDGWWPPVVPGTSFPTLGGCLAMNIHGKNHYKMGGIGDHVQEIDLVTPAGEIHTLSREQRPELFHAAISGFGMLGAITRIKLQLKRVHGGRLRVAQWAVPDLRAQFEAFQDASRFDYFVSWVDCIGGGAAGRGQLHRATYTAPGEDPMGTRTQNVAGQSLPKTMMGVPMPLVPTVLKIFYSSNLGVHFTNEAKYRASTLGSTADYYQSHAAFHFLLDQMPGFRNAYEPGGFLQYQPFVPAENAERVFNEILRVSKQRGIMSYLGVLKRYRPDDFLLSHALDGYSLALDYPITRANQAPLYAMLHELTELVLDAGGRFYPAKDSILRPEHFRRAFGQEAITRFRTLRDQCDPNRILRTNWAARVGVDEG